MLLVLAISAILWAIMVVAYTTFVCTPVSYYWNKSSHNGHCLSSGTYKIFNITAAVIGAVSDMILFLLPMPTLWQVELKPKQKIALMFVFGIGFAYVKAAHILIGAMANVQHRVCSFSVLRVVQFFYFDTAHLSSMFSLTLFAGICVQL